MKITRQHILLAALVPLVGYILVPYLGREDASAGAPGGADVLTAGDIELPPDLDLAARKGDRPGFNPSGGRNLFAYGQPPRPATAAPPPRKTKRPPPSPRIAEQQTPVKVKTPPPPLLPPQTAVQPARPIPPRVNFKYIGYIGPNAARIAVFSVSTEDGKEIALAREGEILQMGATADLPAVQEKLDQFLVRTIGYEEVEIGYTDGLFADESKTLLMGDRS